MPQSQGRENLSAGRFIDVCNVNNLKGAIVEQGTKGYDFVCINVSHPRCCLDLTQLEAKAKVLSNVPGNKMPTKVIDELLPPLGIADISLTSNEWSRLVVGKPSPWIDADSPDPFIRRISEKALKEELTYFAYLSVPAIVIRLRRDENPNLARIVQSQLAASASASYAVWIEVPMIAPTETANGHGTAAASSIETEEDSGAAGDAATSESTSQKNGHEGSPEDTWHWFYKFRRSCNNHRRVHLLLEITADLPDSPTEIARWKGEPISAIKMNTHSFMANNRGYPVLSKAHQEVVKEFFQLNLQCLVEGSVIHSRRQSTKRRVEPEPEDPKCLYYTYLNNLWKHAEVNDQQAEWASGYEDFLQLPLQPLGDHLEAEIYETFERDPVKYQLYRDAFEEAVSIKTVNWPRGQTLVAMVLGAGRGPLVSVAYEVLKNANHPFKLYAVEKNPCAIVTLRKKRADEWNNEVEVVFTDMRNFHPEEKADIVISELLGSFGDNELSPECLDGALHLMQPHCICIPESYRSYIAPVHSPKLMNEVRVAAEREHNALVAFESPYVVRVFNHFEIAKAQLLFQFEHPNWEVRTNERYKKVKFYASESSEMMGLVGYFHASLFGSFKTSLSTVPTFETHRLSSWFPIMFSLPYPIYVKKGELIEVHFWRCVNERQVWYEWQLMSPVVTNVMNARGRSYAIRLI